MLPSLAASQDAADNVDNVEESLLLLPAARTTVQRINAMNAYPCTAVFDSCWQWLFGPGNILRSQKLYWRNLFDLGAQEAIGPARLLSRQRLRTEGFSFRRVRSGNTSWEQFANLSGLTRRRRLSTSLGNLPGTDIGLVVTSVENSAEIVPEACH